MPADRLLVLDDEPYIGVVIKRIAEASGYDVQVTGRADAFMTAYADFHPDAIVLDLAVPDMDGIELLRWLADAGCQNPIVIASGFDVKVIEAAKTLGEVRGLRMAGIISKPLRVADLRATLDALRPAA
jgi:DNA-binding response OmpR family regulator